MKQVLIALVVIMLAALGAAAFHFSVSEVDKKARTARAKKVNIVEPLQQPISDKVIAVGTLQSRSAITLSSEVSGRIVAVHFNSGQRVEKGALLVQLDDRQAKADLQVVQAQLADAQRQLLRASKLKSTNSISQSQVDELHTAVNVAEAELAAVKVNLENHRLLAPFSGRIGLRDISEGAYIKDGDAITTLDAIDPMELAFAVPERFISHVQVGQAITATATGYPDLDFNGELAELGTRVDPLSRTLPVRALIDNADGRLLPGMFMSVRLVLRQRDALVIPEQAVLMLGAEQFVYVVDGEQAVRRPVKLGARDQGLVEVREGVSIDEQVVITGQDRLSNGDKVQVAKEGNPIPVMTEQEQ